MLFLGDNARFGTKRVELSSERLVDPVVRDDKPFPFGVDGLVPVVTERRKKGGCKVVYAFPFGEGEPPTDNPAAQELCDAVGFVNQLLQEAGELSDHEFGAIGALWLEVPERGYSFTDDCAAVESLGTIVKATHGSYQNIKITTPEDILVAEALLTREDK